MDTDETRDALADYYTSVEMLDVNIGKFLGSLEKNGCLDNSLLIYTSDHGPNFPFAKWCPYDEGIRVPFIARWPGVIPPATSADAMISLADIVPTAVEAAGGTAPPDLDGQSFLEVLKGQAKEHRESVFASHAGNNNSELLKTLQAQLSEWRARQGDDVPVYTGKQYVAPDVRQGGG